MQDVQTRPHLRPGFVAVVMLTLLQGLGHYPRLACLFSEAHPCVWMFRCSCAVNRGSNRRNTATAMLTSGEFWAASFLDTNHLQLPCCCAWSPSQSQSRSWSRTRSQSRTHELRCVVWCARVSSTTETRIFQRVVASPGGTARRSDTEYGTKRPVSACDKI